MKLFKQRLARHFRARYFGLSCLVLVTVLVATSSDAKPPYAIETGAKCVFCHDGPMANKKFTPDGKAYCQYLKNQGLIPVQRCKMTTIELYDQKGNFMRNHKHCVPYGPPAPC